MTKQDQPLEDRCDECNKLLEGVVFLDHQKALCGDCMLKENDNA